MAVRKLRPHQAEAVRAIIRGLDIPPGGVPANGLRATVVSACGTGKTLIAAHAARRIAKGGRILVMLPTLDLLTQTVREWRAEGHRGPSVAVCSLDDDPVLHAAGVRTTTNPIQLSLRHGNGPVTVYATYSSLGVIAEACQGNYGQVMSPFDLIVVDEAHRTSGSFGKAWATIHDQQQIPSVRRLYLTATPRVWQERQAVRDVRQGSHVRLKEEMACSMDDPEVFGPVVFELGLADAISLGLLARYQILVMELKDPEVTPEMLRGPDKGEEEVRGKRLGSLQAALLDTAATNNLRTTITFHHRTVEAEAFSEGLKQVAAKMHKENPDLYPARVWSGWLKGEHESEYRAAKLREFGSSAHPAFLSNCRVLGEGVDCPAVDSVALLDPKGSSVDIVQAIGRALRQAPNSGKVASLIVPVFLGDDEDPEDIVTSASYKPLVNVLEGLRAHDERAVEMLAVPQADSGDSATESIGVPPGEGEEESRMLLRFSSPRNPVSVADFISLRVIDTERRDWTAGYAAARAWLARVGHLRVPLGAVEGAYPLGRWIRRQREAYAAGTMDGRRAARLEKLGMVWSPGEVEWEDNVAAAEAYFALTGTLAAPRGAVVPEVGGEPGRALEGPGGAAGRPVGQWLTNCRRPGALSEERAARLAAIDPDWNPSWPIGWQRQYAAVRALVESGVSVGELEGVTVGGVDMGRWVARQRAGWASLSEGQRERLEALGVTAESAPAEVPAFPVPMARSGRGAAAWDRGVRAARQYLERHGHLTVPRAHVEPVVDDGQEHGVKLGVWLSNQRSRRASLAPERAAVLAELGI